MKTKEQFTEALAKAAKEIIAEGPSDNRADRLELACRYLMCCSIISEMTWDECKKLLAVQKTPFDIWAPDTLENAMKPMVPIGRILVEIK